MTDAPQVSHWFLSRRCPHCNARLYTDGAHIYCGVCGEIAAEAATPDGVTLLHKTLAAEGAGKATGAPDVRPLMEIAEDAAARAGGDVNFMFESFVRAIKRSTEELNAMWAEGEG